MLWFRCLTSKPTLLILLFQMADLQPARGPTSLSIGPACGHLSPHQDKPTFPFQKVLVGPLPISLPWYISSSCAFARAGPCCPPHTYSKRVRTAHSQRPAVYHIKPWLPCSAHLGSVHSEHGCQINMFFQRVPPTL